MIVRIKQFEYFIPILRILTIKYDKLIKKLHNRFLIKKLNPWWTKIARELNFTVHSKTSRACSERYIRLFSVQNVNDTSFNIILSNNGQTCKSHMNSV